MSLSVFLSIIGGAFSSFCLGWWYLSDHLAKVKRLKDLYERLCISLSEKQMLPRNHERACAPGVNDLFPPGAMYITSIELIGDPAAPGVQLMDQFDRISPSMFPRPIMRLWLLSALIAVFGTTLLLFAIGSIPEVDVFFRNKFVLAIVLAGLTGALSFIVVATIGMKLVFDMNFIDLRVALEKWAVWKTANGASANDREIILARNDPAFLYLSK